MLLAWQQQQPRETELAQAKETLAHREGQKSGLTLSRFFRFRPHSVPKSEMNQGKEVALRPWMSGSWLFPQDWGIRTVGVY